jgi:CRISPR-associated protein Cmr2
MSYFIVVTIGPVQSYISQARRTQDLFQGSRILSYLAGRGVDKAHELAGADHVVYPSLPEMTGQSRPPEEYGSVPNRLVIDWQGDEASAITCANAIKETITASWLTLSRNTREYFLPATGGNDEAIWKAQEQHWLECYWVVVEQNPDESYADNMQFANEMMGSRKLLREFMQIDEQSIKDSITGEHGVLHDGKDAVAYWRKRKAEQRNKALLGDSERLSAISTIKRFAHEQDKDNQPINPPLVIEKRYPSTSSIAVAPFKYDVLKALPQSPDLVKALDDYIIALEAVFKKPSDLYFSIRNRYNMEYFPYIDEQAAETMRDTQLAELVQKFRSIDGDYLYEDTLISKTIEEYSGHLPEPSEMKTLQSALKTLTKAARALEITPPQPYLAILSMDGDHMGKTIGTLFDAIQHQGFSTDLAQYARDRVERIVQHDYLGRVVYAGGDDVLALLPVRDVLQVADDLRKAFSEAMSKYPNQNGEMLTASTGIAFVHHTHDLQQAIDEANKAQKDIAKEAYKRNALAVKLLRRSGEYREMGSKWTVDKTAIIPSILTLVEAFRHNILGRSLPYDVAQIAYQMDTSNVPIDAQRAEIRRIIKRRLSEAKNLPSLKYLSSTLQEQEQEIYKIITDLAGITPTIETVQRWLELARFIAQKESDR